MGAASAPVAAVPLKKFAPQRPDAAVVLLTECMRIVRHFDLTTAAGIDKFAQEMILQLTPARMDADFGAMNPEDAREVRKADTLSAASISGCTWSPVSDPRSAGMSHHPLHLVLIVHGSATAHVTRGVVVLVRVETNTVMCIPSGM